MPIPNINELTASYRQQQVLELSRLDEMEKAMAAMGPYALVGNYVTAAEVINVVRELKATRHKTV